MLHKPFYDQSLLRLIDLKTSNCYQSFLIESAEKYYFSALFSKRLEGFDKPIEHSDFKAHGAEKAEFTRSK